MDMNGVSTYFSVDLVKDTLIPVLDLFQADINKLRNITEPPPPSLCV